MTPAAGQKTTIKIPKALHKRLRHLASIHTPPTKAPGLATYALERFAAKQEAKANKRNAT